MGAGPPQRWPLAWSTMSFIWGVVAALGLATLITRYAQALVVLKIAGGAYLLWLACKSARSAVQSDAAQVALAIPAADLGAMYRRGVLMHVGNPKAILSWLALMPLAVGANASADRVALAFGGCVALGKSRIDRRVASGVGSARPQSLG